MLNMYSNVLYSLGCWTEVNIHSLIMEKVAISSNFVNERKNTFLIIHLVITLFLTIIFKLTVTCLS